MHKQRRCSKAAGPRSPGKKCAWFEPKHLQAAIDCTQLDALKLCRTMITLRCGCRQKRRCTCSRRRHARSGEPRGQPTVWRQHPGDSWFSQLQLQLQQSWALCRVRSTECSDPLSPAARMVWSAWRPRRAKLIMQSAPHAAKTALFLVSLKQRCQDKHAGKLCVRMAGPGPARADIVYDAVRSSVRPQTDDKTAVVTLLDARGTLMELKVRTAARALASCCASLAPMLTRRAQQHTCLPRPIAIIAVARPASRCASSDVLPAVAPGAGGNAGRQPGTIPCPQDSARHGEAPPRGVRAAFFAAWRPEPVPETRPSSRRCSHAILSANMCLT